MVGPDIENVGSMLKDLFGEMKYYITQQPLVCEQIGNNPLMSNLSLYMLKT